jgi:cephalosporin-C deacetylase-like acetyl esterase
VRRVKDAQRSIDFLESRKDIDKDRTGFYGISLGAYNGTILTAIDPRLKASVLVGGGLALRPRPAEIDGFNFAPRVKVPTLMVNGRSDFTYPYETSQLPLFRLLTLPAEQKHHATFDGGHIPAKIHDVIKVILDWYDRFLGPVATTG